ncbi:hypothetical protein OXX69_009435 [Metschnikowia pulcherrima]
MKSQLLLFAISVPLSLAGAQSSETFSCDKFASAIPSQNCVLRAGSTWPQEVAHPDSSISKYTKRSDRPSRRQAIEKARKRTEECFQCLQSFISDHSFDARLFHFTEEKLREDMTKLSLLVDGISPPEPMVSRELMLAKEMFTDMLTYARLLKEENNDGPFADRVLCDISELKVLLYTLYDTHGHPNTRLDGFKKKLSFFRLRGEILDLARQEVAKTHLTASLLLGFDLKKVWDSLNFLNSCHEDEGFDSEEAIDDELDFELDLDLELDLEHFMDSDILPHFNALKGHALNY